MQFQAWDINHEWSQHRWVFNRIPIQVQARPLCSRRPCQGGPGCFLRRQLSSRPSNSRLLTFLSMRRLSLPQWGTAWFFWDMLPLLPCWIRLYPQGSEPQACVVYSLVWNPSSSSSEEVASACPMAAHHRFNAYKGWPAAQKGPLPISWCLMLKHPCEF